MAFTQKKVILLALLVLNLMDLKNCQMEDQLRASVSIEDQRAYIKISVLLNKGPLQVYRELHRALGGRAYSESRVHEIYREFESGVRLSCEDLPRSGRPTTANTPENRERLQQLMDQSRAWSIDDLADELQMSSR